MECESPACQLGVHQTRDVHHLFLATKTKTLLKNLIKSSTSMLQFILVPGKAEL